MNRAFYGDIHGCIDELKDLYNKVETKYPGIEHWHLGDMWDRGPDSGAVSAFVYDRFEGGVIGNHEASILTIYKIWKKSGNIGGNDDKKRTFNSIQAQPNADKLWKQASELPPLHVFDDVGLIIAHGGVYPEIPLYKQNINCSRLQMIKLDNEMMRNKVRWFGQDAIHQPKVKKTEEESRKEGYIRWYEAYDYDYDIIFGHSVVGLKPFYYRNKNHGRTIGIDTGSCFGGNLTAYIYPAEDVIQVQCGYYSGVKVDHILKEFE